MPFVQTAANGEIEALFLQAAAGRQYLPLSDPKVLQFLQASDPALTTALLNASDDAHHLLLSSLIDLLVRNQTLHGKAVLSGTGGEWVPRRQLGELIETVETCEDEALQTLTASDRNTVRVIEDVIDVLIALDVISLSDLPPSAQHLLSVRRALRAYLSDQDDGLDEL